jgi:hypothetical protein
VTPKWSGCTARYLPDYGSCNLACLSGDTKGREQFGQSLQSLSSYSESTRRVCSIRISSAILVLDNRTSSANGAFGRHDRQDNAGMRPVTAASRCRSSVRRSIAFMVRQAGHRTHRNQCRAVIAAPIVGENNMGIRWPWRAFQARIRRSASPQALERPSRDGEPPQRQPWPSARLPFCGD